MKNLISFLLIVLFSAGCTNCSSQEKTTSTPTQHTQATSPVEEFKPRLELYDNVTEPVEEAKKTPDTVQWISGTEVAFNTAIMLDRPVMLVFINSDCKECDDIMKMYNEKEVASYVNEHYVPLKMHIGTDPEAKEMASNNGIEVFPTSDFVYFTQEKDDIKVVPIARIAGVPPDSATQLEVLQKIIELIANGK